MKLKKDKLISYFLTLQENFLPYLLPLSLLIIFNIDINHIVAFFRGVEFPVPISKHSGNILAPFFAGLSFLLLLGSFIIKNNRG